MTSGRVLAAIAVGGVVGSLGRYAVGSLLPHPAGTWPWATVVVNVTGCLLMGLLVAFLSVREHTPAWLRPGLGVGVLGGWTTFSTFAEDVVTLGRSGAAGLAAAYVVVSVLGGVLAVGVGMLAGQRIWSDPEPRT